MRRAKKGSMQVVPSSYLVSYLAVLWLGTEAVQGPVVNRLGALVLLAVQ